MRSDKKILTVALSMTIIITILLSLLLISSLSQKKIITKKVNIRWQCSGMKESHDVSYGGTIAAVEADGSDVVKPDYIESNESDSDNSDYIISGEFDPNQWIKTDDTKLVNYVTTNNTKLPVYKKWTNVSGTYTDVDGPNNEFESKTYMHMQAVGYGSGNIQSHLMRGRYAYTSDYHIRCVDNRMLIALGSAYTHTKGAYVDVRLKDGTVLACMLGDAKSDKDTDATHRYQKYDKSVVEFVIDDPGYKYSRSLGVCGNYANIDIFSSKVDKIRIYDKVFNIDMTDQSNDNPE